MILASCTGPCAARIRQIDWSSTPVGPMERWPDQLRGMLATMLRTAAPKLLMWGSELTTFYNDACAGIFGDLGVSGIGAPYPSFRPRSWAVVGDQVRRAWQGEERLRGEINLPPGPEGKDQACFYDLFFSTVFGPGGQPAGVLVDIQDSTPVRRMSEILLLENRNLQRLFAETPVLIAYGAGPELRLQFVNKAFRQLMGSRPLEGLPAIEAIPELREQGFDSLLAEAYRTGEPFVGENVPVTLRNGGGHPERTRFIDFVYQPVRNEAGEVIGILYSGTDVTDKQMAREESERLKRQVLHASRVNAMGTMAITLAHELNQPLAAASNYVAACRKLLARESLSEDATILESLERAQDQIVRAGEVIRRIRSVVRAGDADRQPVSVERAIDRVAYLLEGGDELDLTLTRKISADATHVMADEIQLEQVLINLVRNAAEASRQAERKEVVVMTERVEPDRVRISLRDFGNGLRPEQVENLFGGIRPEESQGLGVGLSLSRTLIEANGGSLRAANADGGGAIFMFDLEVPAVDPAESLLLGN